MMVKTKAYGEIEVDERQKLFFPKGLFGFEHLHDYVLLDSTQEPFYWLQSLDEQEVAFILIDPTIFRKDFHLDSSEEDLDEIDLKSVENGRALIFAIVTIPDDHQKMSANLQGPIVINRDNHQGRQVISIDNKWKVKHYILEEMIGSTPC